MIDTAIYIGRFQPFHQGHLQNCIQALKQAKKLIILIGSAGIGPVPMNPWSFEERCQMILSSLPEQDQARVTLLPIYDSLYNQTAWEKRVKKLVDDHSSITDSKALVIFAKDASSFYLDCFPEWQQIHLPMVVDQAQVCISATHIRKQFFEHANVTEDLVPPSVCEMLLAFKTNPCFKALVDAHQAFNHDLSHRKTLFTLILYNEQNVLLSKRTQSLGLGQLALPTFATQKQLDDFLDNHFPHHDVIESKTIESLMLKLPYKLTYAKLSVFNALPKNYSLGCHDTIIQDDLFADHRSILFDPMKLSF